MECRRRQARNFGDNDPRILNFDRNRRLGMGYAAEIALQEVAILLSNRNAMHTSGVNAYIETLTESSLPLEYKLIGYKPEKWSNLKKHL